jgi:uncharacterized protein (TIGR04255 family)
MYHGSLGVILDIDVFNILATNAPTWSTADRWFEEAHSVENSIFEDVITDRLRAAFQSTLALASRTP